jgi:hypothetical protein
MGQTRGRLEDDRQRTMNVVQDPAAVALPAEDLDAYVGVYQVDQAIGSRSGATAMVWWLAPTAARPSR